LADLKRRHAGVLSELAAVRADYDELSRANKSMASELSCANEEIAALRQMVR
jgi:hypothetical protein